MRRWSDAIERKSETLALSPNIAKEVDRVSVRDTTEDGMSFFWVVGAWKSASIINALKRKLRPSARYTHDISGEKSCVQNQTILA